jgi:hypothetical protein
MGNLEMIAFLNRLKRLQCIFSRLKREEVILQKRKKNGQGS